MTEQTLAQHLSAADGQPLDSQDADISPADGQQLATWLADLVQDMPPATFDGAMLADQASRAQTNTAPIPVIGPANKVLRQRPHFRRRWQTGLLAAAALAVVAVVGISVAMSLRDAGRTDTASVTASAPAATVAAPSPAHSEGAARPQTSGPVPSAVAPAAPAPEVTRDTSDAPKKSTVRTCPLTPAAMAAAERQLPPHTPVQQADCRAQWTINSGGVITVVVQRATAAACVTSENCEPAKGGYLRRTGSALAAFGYANGWEVVLTTSGAITGFDDAAALATVQTVLGTLR